MCCILGVLSMLMSTAFNFSHPKRFQASLITFCAIFYIFKYIQNNLYFLNVQSTCSKSCTLWYKEVSTFFNELVSMNVKDNEYIASRVTLEMMQKDFGRKQTWPNASVISRLAWSNCGKPLKICKQCPSEVSKQASHIQVYTFFWSP